MRKIIISLFLLLPLAAEAQERYRTLRLEQVNG